MAAELVLSDPELGRTALACPEDSSPPLPLRSKQDFVYAQRSHGDGRLRALSCRASKGWFGGSQEFSSHGGMTPRGLRSSLWLCKVLPTCGIAGG